MDKIFLSPLSDEEIEALVSMSPEEVDAELVALGLDPDAPLPEGIEHLITTWETDGASGGGTSRVINAAEKFGFKNNDLKKRHSQSTRELLQQGAAVFLKGAAALLIGVLGLISLSSSLRNHELASVKNASVFPLPVSKPKPQLSPDNPVYTAVFEKNYRQATQPYRRL